MLQDGQLAQSPTSLPKHPVVLAWLTWQLIVAYTTLPLLQLLPTPAEGSLSLALSDLMLPIKSVLSRGPPWE